MNDWANNDRQVPQPQLPVLDPPSNEIVTAELADAPQPARPKLLIPALLFLPSYLS